MPIKNSNPLVMPNIRDHAHRRTVIGISLFLVIIVIAGIVYVVMKNQAEKKNAELLNRYEQESAQAVMQSQEMQEFLKQPIPTLTDKDRKAMMDMIAQNSPQEIFDISSPEVQAAIRAIQLEQQTSFDAGFEAWKKQNK